MINRGNVRHNSTLNPCANIFVPQIHQMPHYRTGLNPNAVAFVSEHRKNTDKDFNSEYSKLTRSANDFIGNRMPSILKISIPDQSFF